MANCDFLLIFALEIILLIYSILMATYYVNSRLPADSVDHEE